MKRDEDFGLDRRIEFETDDEENEAQRVCEIGDETESDGSGPYRNASSYCMESNSPSWPQSYRRSMDMYTGVTPPSVSFLTGTSLTRISSSLLPSSLKSPQAFTSDSSLSKPLISATSIDREEVPTSTLPTRLSATTCSSSVSLNELSTLQQCSYGQSLLNAINVLCGMGLLTTPYALKEGGWWSLILLLIMGLICGYTGILLKRCLESSPGLKTYPDIGQAAFGIAGRVCIAVTLYMDLYSTCVEYIIMMSDNLSTLFPSIQVVFAGIHLDSHQIFAITTTLLILPTVWLRKLSLLSYISVGGVVTAVLLILCLLWVGVVDEVGFHPNGTVLNFANLPVTIGLFGFCFGSHSVFPNIYSSMKEPSGYSSALIISFVISLLLYAGVAVCGFLMFGESTEPQFTLSMPKKFVASKIAAWTTVVTPVTKYALTITPIAFSLEELLPTAELRTYGASILIRTVLVISTLAVALAVPYFDSVSALIGSFLVMLVSLVFPCACYLSILRGRLSLLQVAVCILIIIVGVLFSVVGTYSAIASIADRV